MQTPTFKSLITKSAMLAGAVAGALALSAAPATADPLPAASHGSDWALAAEGDDGGYVVMVSDEECDNHRVWVEWVNYNSTVIHTLTDGDGCGGDIYMQPQSTSVSSLRVCERTRGCSNWE
jgi:hypothetical protein